MDMTKSNSNLNLEADEPVLSSQKTSRRWMIIAAVSAIVVVAGFLWYLAGSSKTNSHFDEQRQTNQLTDEGFSAEMNLYDSEFHHGLTMVKPTQMIASVHETEYVGPTITELYGNDDPFSMPWALRYEKCLAMPQTSVMELHKHFKVNANIIVEMINRHVFPHFTPDYYQVPIDDVLLGLVDWQTTTKAPIPACVLERLHNMASNFKGEWADPLGENFERVVLQFFNNAVTYHDWHAMEYCFEHGLVLHLKDHLDPAAFNYEMINAYAVLLWYAPTSIKNSLLGAVYELISPTDGFQEVANKLLSWKQITKESLETMSSYISTLPKFQATQRHHPSIAFRLFAITQANSMAQEREPLRDLGWNKYDYDESYSLFGFITQPCVDQALAIGMVSQFFSSEYVKECLRYLIIYEISPSLTLNHLQNIKKLLDACVLVETRDGFEKIRLTKESWNSKKRSWLHAPASHRQVMTEISELTTKFIKVY